MLDVRREAEAVVVAWDGLLDEVAADRILAAVYLIEEPMMVVLDLTRATTVSDTALARLAQSRALEFRGLREHQERLLTYLVKGHPREAGMDTSPLEECENIVKATTDAFCKVFLEEGDFRGPSAQAVGRGSLPNGVDPHDPRVLAIRRKCQECAAADSEVPFTD